MKTVGSIYADLRAVSNEFLHETLKHEAKNVPRSVRSDIAILSTLLDELETTGRGLAVDDEMGLTIERARLKLLYATNPELFVQEMSAAADVIAPCYK